MRVIGIAQADTTNRVSSFYDTIREIISDSTPQGRGER
jgi:hypothetical protein